MQKWFAACAFLVFCAAVGIAEEEKPGTQTLRLVQDDAQDYMVSKIYVLKYKAKKNEKKKIGHRQDYTKIQITRIVG